MKQIYLTIFLAFFLLSGASYAQTEQGKIIISGSSTLNFSSEKSKSEYSGQQMGSDEKYNVFSITPRVGYFVIDNLAIGLSVDIESIDWDGEKMSSFSAGPAVRYYYDLDRIKPFAQAEMTIGTNDYGNDDKYNDISFGAGAGVACFLNDFISFDFGVVFQNCTEKSKDDNDYKYITNGVYFNAGFSMFF